MKKLLLLAIVVLGISTVSFGQSGVSDFATSTATIITPITIAKSVDLNFGTISVNNQAGTVVLPAVTGTPTRTATGGVKLPAVTGTVTAAKFTVTGLAGSVYTISMPGTIELSSGGNKMNYVPSFLPATLSTLTSGDNFIYVGGTLTVGASQPAGTYINNTDLVVRVDYN